MSSPITTAMIKDLRDRTGIGMNKCKEALEEAKGDIELAISNLRKSGMASAVKKEGRETKEGQIAFVEKGNTVGVVEINAETDFVVRNDRFQQFLNEMANEVASTAPESTESFLKQHFSKDKSLTIDQYRATIVQAIGENIQIRRVRAMIKNPHHSVGFYSHGGKIFTSAEIEGSGSEEKLAYDISMHIAAASPEFLSPEKVTEEALNKEKDIAKGQVKGKPANIIDKIVEGKLNAFYETACLTRQKYIRDDSMTIEELVAKRGKEINKPLKLTAFLRWQVGKS